MHERRRKTASARKRSARDAKMRRRRRRSGKRRSEENGRRKSKKRENVKTGKNEREGNRTSTMKEDIRMMMATKEKRGAIASGIVIAIALLAIGPLITTAKRR